jgi:hypothetical protein
MPKTGQQTTDDDEYGQECVVATNNQLRNNYECLYSIIYKLPAPHASYTLAHLHTIPPASSTKRWPAHVAGVITTRRWWWSVRWCNKVRGPKGRGDHKETPRVPSVALAGQQTWTARWHPPPMRAVEEPPGAGAPPSRPRTS